QSNNRRNSSSRSTSRRPRQSAWPASGNADDRLAQLGLGNCVRPMSEAFRSGLAVGNNIRVLYRYADGHVERLSALASELVSLVALVIVTNGGSSIQAAHNAAPSVPISRPDPVMMGCAQRLTRPGGMITGLFYIGVLSKRLEMLKEVRPQAT